MAPPDAPGLPDPPCAPGAVPPCIFFAEVVKGLAGGEEVSLEGPETKMQGGKAPGAQGGSGRPGASGGATNRPPSAGGPRAGH